MPFTVTQFLWINLVMDSLAAIALASEPAEEKVLLDKPRDKKEFIINKSLGKAIFGFGGFIWILCVFLLWRGIDSTIFFATYMSINWWNMFNARVIGKNKSVFEGLFKNSKFVGILVFILVVTILIVQFGGEVFNTKPLSAETWGYILLLTSPICWVRELYHQLIGKRK
jgi:Ca2+-transporting ATPase